METTKRCGKCKELKEYNFFSKNKHDKTGRRSDCKVCENRDKRAYYGRTKEAKKEYQKANAEYISQRKHNHYLQNRERILKYQKDNPEKHNAVQAKRRAAKANATPKWLSSQQLAEIADIYKQAKELENIFFNRKFQVDHIIPLKHSDVCGLHVPWNLQILTAEENRKKTNKLYKL